MKGRYTERLRKAMFELNAPEPDLRAVRDALGITQRRLGIELGIAAETMCRLEKGARKPSRTTVLALRYLVLERMGRAP